MIKKVAVLLAGCGSLDGSEIQESVLTLLAIKQNGANYQCFSIDQDQHHVSNHLLKKFATDKRNILEESARIARSDIKLLSSFDVDEYDAIIIPGGYGVVYNFCDFATKVKDFQVRDDIADICRNFTKMGKPIGFICIAPIMITKIYQDLVKIKEQPIKMTMGNNKDFIEIVNSFNMEHIETDTTNICVDNDYKIVTSPAYLLDTDISQLYIGINKLVQAVLNLI